MEDLFIPLLRDSLGADEVEELSRSLVPLPAYEHFLAKGGLYILPEHFFPSSLHGFVWVRTADFDAFFCEDRKTYDTSHHTEELVYVYLRGKRGARRKIGHAEIRRDITPRKAIHDGQPFIGMISIEHGYRRLGFGTKLAQLMSTIARCRFGQQLFTGELVSEEFGAVLRKLAVSGLATHVNDRSYLLT